MPPPLPSPAQSQPPRTPTLGFLLRVLAGALLLALISDFVLWGAVPGLSWGIYLLLLGGALLVGRLRAAWSWQGWALLGLLAVMAVQSAVEISFSNVLTSLVLLLGLLGETSYLSLRPGWQRFSEACVALCKAPVRGVVVFFEILSADWDRRKGAKAAWSVGRLISIALPAVFLGLIFTALLAGGNAILKLWLDGVWEAFWRWIDALDISFAHAVTFLLLCGVALFYLYPSRPDAWVPRVWWRTVGRWPSLNAETGWWRSVVILGLLNALFFLVNTLDVIYLWLRGMQLPQGVGYSQYVHEGVWSLITAALLSAVVLSALFQQDERVSRSPWVRRLGLFWVAQNGVLIAGVLLRLWLYVRAHLLSCQRVYAFLFVLLVAVGFLLLAVYILRNRTLNWLIGANALACLALFFIVSLLPVKGWVADYNVAAHERNPERRLDFEYLEELGHHAWPALARLAASSKPESAVAQKTNARLRELQKQESSKPAQNWRSWQGRERAHVRWLLRQQF